MFGDWDADQSSPTDTPGSLLSVFTVSFPLGFTVTLFYSCDTFKVLSLWWTGPWPPRVTSSSLEHVYVILRGRRDFAELI